MVSHTYCRQFFLLILLIIFQGQNITDDIQISVTKPGFYFAADLQINSHVPLSGKIDVYCYLGEYPITITSKKFDSSEGLLTLLLVFHTCVIMTSFDI